MFLFRNLSKIGRIGVSDICSKSNFTLEMSEGIKQLQEQSREAKSRFERSKSSSRFRYNGKIRKRQWEDDNARTPEEKAAKIMNSEDKVKRRKHVLLLGYSGVNYFGMQRNPGQKTIEEDLFVAMLKHKWVTEEGFNQAQYAYFQRAARTDKGVSAARQICSMKIPDEVDIEALNNDLPEQIRVFCVRRVTKGFNSKDQCDARTYTYTLPTIAFADHGDKVEMETYRVPQEKLEKLDGLLKMFLGTKNFHNFTSKKEFIDPSSRRYIISFECHTPRIEESGVEYATIKIKGQSFMLHQIRKMVGLTLAVLRGYTEPKTINRAFTADRLDLPIAPGLGLVLDQVHYDRYNRRYGVDGVHEKLEWDDVEMKIKAFADKYIYPTIYETELKEKSMTLWLETLHNHSYDVRSEDLKNKTEPKSLIQTSPSQN